MIGKTISHYKIVDKLGEGGMGQVYLADDTSLDRKVALKFLPEDLQQDPTARKRILREAKAAAALDHPYICNIFQVGEEEDIAFIAMEYVQGQTLKEKLSEGPLPFREAIKTAAEIAEALEKAHQEEIVHRDLKPANIMFTPGGHVKVMDFGLAKHVSLAEGENAPDQTMTVSLTEEGVTLGTLAYMSPEQLRAETVDTRSDIFSFGVVLYEMLTGVHPFKKPTPMDTASAILSSTPPPIEAHVQGISDTLVQIVDSMLQKRSRDRLAPVSALIDALNAHQREQLEHSAAGLGGFGVVRNLAKPAVALPVLIATLVVAFIGIRYVNRSAKVRWASLEAIPEAYLLQESGDMLGAFAIAEEIERYLPDDPALTELFAQVSSSLQITTDPSGADVYYRHPLGSDDIWLYAGQTPIKAERFPEDPIRWRIEKDGFEVSEFFGRGRERSVSLRPKDQEPQGMVQIPAGSVGWTQLINLGGASNKSVSLGGFFIDCFEVTNQQFKAFVDAGGYENPQYWKHDFVRDGVVVSWEEVLAEFRDATGWASPSTWRLGDYPDGEDDFPVTGVSWFEAAAYAEFVGRNLPTVFHWTRAAAPDRSPLIVPFSNLDGAGPVAVGNSNAMSPSGVYDMAGNAREWCFNEVDGRRSILGGSWEDPIYMFGSINDAQSPWDRSSVNGFRTALYSDSVSEELLTPLFVEVRDYENELPVSDEVFNVYRQLFTYDQGELNAISTVVDDTSNFWVHERVEFDAAYGSDRVTADLYLPHDYSPPFQVVIIFPGSGAINASAIKRVDMVDFLVRSGRAVMYPSYKGTYDRSDGETFTWPSTTTRFRDDLVKWGKDLSRSIDYLRTRDDIDSNRIAYLGNSWGGRMGTIFPAIEMRIRVVILWLGGLASGVARPEVDQINYVTRITQPVLMLNGRYDAIEPYDMAQLPLYRLLGTPVEDKRHVIYETAHGLPENARIKETVDWLNKYLGPVEH
ncbi:protein kinase [Gemmatimonadota bacterium]